VSSRIRRREEWRKVGGKITQKRAGKRSESEGKRK
jgi:hypothetical protein